MKLSLKLDCQKTYIISVSGGVDSMVLLDFLWSQKLILKVVHFNHLIRLDSYQDKELVQTYCKTRDIPFYCFEINLPKKNFQAQARLSRQQKLKQIAKKYQTPYIVTAHHLDDLAETILLKLSRGSTLLGYSGMHPQLLMQDFILLKPFLYVTKEQIIQHAKKHQIPFYQDYTNEQTIYQRNKIRHHIIPYLKANTSFLQNIQHFQQQLWQAHTLIRKETILFFNQFVKTCSNSNIQVFMLIPFLNLDLAIQKDIIVFLLEQYNLTKNFFTIKTIVQGLNNHLKPNLFWQISYNWHLVKSYQQVIFSPCKTIKTVDLTSPLLYVSSCRLTLVSLFLLQKINYHHNKIAFPLKIRQRQPGDVVKFIFGTKKLKKFLIDCKVPQKQRNNLWLVVDNCQNILWVPHLYINYTLGNGCVLYLALNTMLSFATQLY